MRWVDLQNCVYDDFICRANTVTMEDKMNNMIESLYPTVRNSGKLIRLGRIVDPADGRGLIATVVYGLLNGPKPNEHENLYNLGEMVKGLGQAGIDGILVSPGFLQIYSPYLVYGSAPGVILCLEWNNMFRNQEHRLGFEEGRSTFIGTIEDALRLGADAILTYIFIGYEDPEIEAYYIRQNALLSRECEKLGMVRIIETMARGRRLQSEEVRRKEYVKLHTRIASEIGCDIIKTEWPGDRDAFQEVVDCCPVPIFLAGGPSTNEPIDTLKLAEDAMRSGAKGLLFGRKILEAKDPYAITKALRNIVHDGYSAEKAALGSGITADK